MKTLGPGYDVLKKGEHVRVDEAPPGVLRELVIVEVLGRETVKVLVRDTPKLDA